MPTTGFITVTPSSSLFNFQLGAAVPALQTVSVEVELFDGTSGYSNIILTRQVSAPWLSAAIIGAVDIINPIELFDVDYSLIEIEANKLIPATYNTNVIYTVSGENDYSGQIDVLASFLHPVSVVVTDTATISVSPSIINFTHTIGAALPLFQMVTPNGPDWILETPIGFLLSSEDLGATITQNGDGSYKAEGTGALIIEVTPQSSILQVVGTENYVGNVKNASGVVQATFAIIVRVNSDETFEVSPSSFSFYEIKDTLLPSSQKLIINSAIAFTIIKPSWLKLSANSGQGYLEISVLPDPAANLDPGIYNENITITRSINGSDVDTLIAVQYEIVDFIKLPGLQGDFWFTLDNKFLEVFTQKTNTYFQLTLSAILYDFYDAQEKTIELPYKIPLFKNQQKFNIGKIIDRLMYRIEKYDDLTVAQYKPAEIQLYIEEIGMGTETVYQTALLSNIKYIAGISPKKIINSCCFLDLNNNPTRVTRNSFAFLNILLKTGNYVLKLYKNTGWVSDTNINAALDNVFTRKIDFSVFEIGDVITYKIIINGEELTKTFILLPTNKESYHIVWEDEYKLKSALEFTGAFSMQNDIENILQKSFQDEVEFTEKISSASEGEFTGSTGWIFKYDQVRIESLLRAKKAWLILSDGTQINIVPISKGLNNIDSEKELYAYTVEFTINKDHDAQSYSF